MYLCACGWTGDSPMMTPEIDAPVKGPSWETNCPKCGRDVEEMPTCTGCGEYAAKLDDDDLCPDCAEQARMCDACDGTGIPRTGPVEGRCGSCGGTGQRQKVEVPYDA